MLVNAYRARLVEQPPEPSEPQGHGHRRASSHLSHKAMATRASRRLSRKAIAPAAARSSFRECQFHATWKTGVAIPPLRKG